MDLQIGCRLEINEFRSSRGATQLAQKNVNCCASSWLIIMLLSRLSSSRCLKFLEILIRFRKMLIRVVQALVQFIPASIKIESVKYIYLKRRRSASHYIFTTLTPTLHCSDYVRLSLHKIFSLNFLFDSVFINFK